MDVKLIFVYIIRLFVFNLFGFFWDTKIPLYQSALLAEVLLTRGTIFGSLFLMSIDMPHWNQYRYKVI